ncbi:MAG: hemolysin family protein [Deferribacteraceae bacterium]|nr:hemolysin family protein [Deferribacteraceae bacterium]
MDGNIAPELVLIVICVVFSAFFSFSETALTGLGEIRTHKLISENNKYSSLLELWINRQFRVLTTILLGNTMALVAAAVLMLKMAEALFPSVHIAAVAAVTAAMLLIFGELLPKAFGRNSSAQSAIACMYIVRIFYYLVFPITFTTAVFADFLTRMIGKKDSQLTEEDITHLLDMSEEQGVLEEGAQQMISSIFEISDTYVKEVMVPRIDMIAVPVDISKDELLILMADNEHSRLPVYEETLDKVIGILYAKDLIKIMRMDWKIADFMATMHEPLFVPETKHIDEMLKEFQRQRQQMAIVVDEYGGVAGIVTMEDILEEIVGDIWDEYDDDDEQEIVAINENEFRVDARMNIDDLCNHFGMERTEDMSDFDTVGGLVYDVAGAIPSEGERFSWCGYEIVIRKMTDNRLEEVDFIKI